MSNPTPSSSSSPPPPPSTHAALTHASNIAVLIILSKPGPPGPTGPGRPALPVEIIIQILSDPSRWVETGRYRLPSPLNVNSVEGSKVVVVTRPFSAKGVRLFRGVRITFTSKDQGWSSFHDDHGTYENSWTWFEVAVGHGIGNLGSPRLLEGEGEGEGGGDGWLWDDQARRGRRRLEWANDDDLAHIKREQIQANRHASRVAEDYQIELEAGEGVLRDLKEGDEIALLAFARYQGWVNYVGAASIAVLEVDDLQEMNR